MFIVTTSPVARLSSVGAARTEVWSPIILGQRPGEYELSAAPTELGAMCGACGYKHCAPSGAFRIPATAPPL